MNNISFNSSRKALSSYSGLVFFKDLASKFNILGELGRILPRKERTRGLAPKKQFETAMLSFIAGSDCLEDIDTLNQDPLFFRLNKGSMSSRTLGRLLRSISLKHAQRLQALLPKLAWKIRQKMFPKSREITISMDATHHKQWGQKMEGVGWNYKSIWCYDSQNAFDEKGFCYGFDFREGGTHSSVGAVDMIGQIFRGIPKYMKRRFLADSAYSNVKIYNELLKFGVDFTMALKENVWSALLRENEFKMIWKKENIEFFGSNKCQIASCYYPVDGLQGRSFLRVVFIRTKNLNRKEGERHYRYYAMVTSAPEHEMKGLEVIRHYRQRSNVENAIKDLKYGMDFLHFPCLNFNANKAWGLIGIFAYNLMKFASYIINPQRGCQMKKVRQKMVRIASELRYGQRKLKLFFTEIFCKEVERLKQEIDSKFGVDISYWGSG